MKAVTDPLKRRQIGRAFYIQIPIAGKCEEEIQQALAETKEIEKAVETMLNGSMSVNDLLESVEHIFPNIDNYAEDVEIALEDTLSSWQLLKIQ